MKTDTDLKRDVTAELDWDPAVKSNAIGVAVKDGVVTLSGHLETFAEKYAAARALRRYAGNPRGRRLPGHPWPRSHGRGARRSRA